MSVSLNGTTAVLTTVQFTEITKVYLSAATTGGIIVTEDTTSGTILAVIAPTHLYARHRRIALWPTPASAITYTVDYERDLADMSNTTDEPVLPLRFHSLLIEGALRREMVKKDDDRYGAAVREYDRMLANLKYFLYTSNDHRPVMGRPTVERPSQLGAWYPAGS